MEITDLLKNIDDVMIIKSNTESLNININMLEFSINFESCKNYIMTEIINETEMDIFHTPMKKYQPRVMTHIKHVLQLRSFNPVSPSVIKLKNKLDLLINKMNMCLNVLDKKMLPINYECAQYTGEGSGSIFMIDNKKSVGNNVKVYCLDESNRVFGFIAELYLNIILQKYIDICPNYQILYNAFISPNNYLNLKNRGKCDKAKTVIGVCTQNYGYMITDQMQHNLVTVDCGIKLTYDVFFEYIYMKLVAKIKENILFTDQIKSQNVMFRIINNADKLYNIHYHIDDHHSKCNFYITSNKLLVPIDLDDYTFVSDANHRNIYYAEYDIFGYDTDDSLMNCVDKSEKPYIEALRHDMIISFKTNVQIDDCINILNKNCPNKYKHPKHGVEYVKYSLVY